MLKLRFVLPALVVGVVLGLSGCDNGNNAKDEDTGSLIINNMTTEKLPVPSGDYDGLFVFLYEFQEDQTIPNTYREFRSLHRNHTSVVAFGRVGTLKNGILNVKLTTINGGKWRGNGQYFVALGSATTGNYNGVGEARVGQTAIAFVNGEAKMDGADFGDLLVEP